MSKTIGFIGAGNINAGHMKNAKALGMEIAAVADVNRAAAEAAAKTYDAKPFEDFNEMLKLGLDGVVIGTPNKFHAPQAVAALQAGSSVFLEKPMAMNAGESEQIIAARDAAGKILQMGMVNRFRGSSQTLVDFIDAGRCGDLYAGQAFWWRRRGIPGFGGWFTTKSMSGGGALIDIGVHLLDLALYLMKFPAPVAVSGSTYNTFRKLEDYTYTSMWAGPPKEGAEKDVDDYATAKIRFSEGQTLALDVSWALNLPNMKPEVGVMLMGTKGGVSMDNLETPAFHGEAEGHIIDVLPQYAKVDPMHAEMANFRDCLTGDAQPLATAEQGRTVQSILDAIYKSSDEGREVRLDA